MSRLFDRLSDCVKYEISDHDAVQLWNHFAEQNSYERIFSMNEFDEIVCGDRSYRDVMNDLSNDFDQNAKYFYADSGYGTWASTNDPFEIIDVSQLVVDIIDNEGQGYPNVSNVGDYFDGYLYEVEMKNVLESLSPQELTAIAQVLWDSREEFNESEVFDPKDEKDFAWERLEEIFYGYDYAPIFMLPEDVQDKFFEFKNPDIDYLRDNIGKRNDNVSVEKALEIAGFVHFEDDPKDIYVLSRGNSYQRFEIKLKDGMIKSADLENQKKQTACR